MLDTKIFLKVFVISYMMLIRPIYPLQGYLLTFSLASETIKMLEIVDVKLINTYSFLATDNTFL